LADVVAVEPPAPSCVRRRQRLAVNAEDQPAQQRRTLRPVFVRACARAL
jgi:hypothetical protein